METRHINQGGMPPDSEFIDANTVYVVNSIGPGQTPIRLRMNDALISPLNVAQRGFQNQGNVADFGGLNRNATTNFNQNGQQPADWRNATGRENHNNSTVGAVLKVQQDVNHVTMLLLEEKQERIQQNMIIDHILGNQRVIMETLERIERSLPRNVCHVEYSQQRSENMLSSASIPTPMSTQDSHHDEENSRFARSGMDHSDLVGGTVFSNRIFAAAHNDQTNDSIASNSNTLTASSFPTSRRQSDSSTTESGYCDDQVNTVARAGSMEAQRNDGSSGDTSEDNPVRLIGSHLAEPELSIVSEVISKKPTLQQRRMNENERANITISTYTPSKRRPSIFSMVDKNRMSNARNVCLDFDDNDEGFVGMAIRERLSQGISGINNILDSEESLPPSNNMISEAGTQKRRKRHSSSGGSKIKRIAKAPVKEEPVRVSSTSRECETFNVSSNENTSESSSPSLDLDISLPVSLSKIKKEKTTCHAIESSIPDPITGLFSCICGHTTTTLSGLRLHVKAQGTEEPKYRCRKPNCTKRFLYPYIVRDHIVREHGDKTCPEKVHGCSKCGFVAYVKEELKNHLNEKGTVCGSRRRRSRSADSPPTQSDVSVLSTGSRNPQGPSIIISL